ncbi:MAG: D-aminoacyl-tRNA deacylase [Candidatus Marinimicrobia bacterium]|jgi:D-tyrosyl-tRNA(Tyr) deacylase|nr:D-aminoacyl-tRNA deacylase [Candidatus Neomarinimicrobiota bacterium]|tara:strand:+ start:834 stop:1277 length:444 start_codon:yes stop_codon:yes gene_type:complete
MIAVVQRVSKGNVTIHGEVKSAIQNGLVVLIGVMQDDTEEDVNFLVEKISGFRIFNDEDDKMNLSVKDIKGSVLVISQFTLCGDWKKGRRPSFIHAAPPEKGKHLYERFMYQLREKEIPVESGEFGAMMSVNLTNEGPVTFVLDSKI